MDLWYGMGRFRPLLLPEVQVRRRRWAAPVGFHNILDLGRDELNARYFEGRTDRLRMEGNGTRLLRAEV